MTHNRIHQTKTFPQLNNIIQTKWNLTSKPVSEWSSSTMDLDQNRTICSSTTHHSRLTSIPQTHTSDAKFSHQIGDNGSSYCRVPVGYVPPKGSIESHDLDPEQKEAAMSDFDTPLAITAGAGSGKTRTMVARIAHMVHQGIPPKNILALTFSKKAANEMKTRVMSSVDSDDATFLSVKTFHSFCLSVLRRNSHKLGRGMDNFVVFNKRQQTSLVENALKRLDQDGKAKTFSLDDEDEKQNRRVKESALKWILRVKALNYEPDSFDQEHRSLLRLYNSLMREENAIDFVDMVVWALKLLKKEPELRFMYHKWFQYVLVDEFQDLNLVQYELLCLLVQGHRRITVIGDDDQSIYGFRGGTSAVFSKFRNKFPESKELQLRRNYRSTSIVVDASQRVIQKNQKRIDKSIYSMKNTGNKIKMAIARTFPQEAEHVASEIEKLHSHENIDYSDIAILCRVRKNVLNIFDKELKRRNIPFVKYRKKSFPERLVVSELVSYLSLMVNDYDNEAFRKVINVPTRKIGKKAVEYLEDYSNEMTRRMSRSRSRSKRMYHPSLLLGANDAVKYDFPATRTSKRLNKTQKQSITNFVKTISIIKEEATRLDIPDLLRKIMDKVKYLEFATKRLKSNSKRYKKNSPSQKKQDSVQDIYDSDSDDEDDFYNDFNSDENSKRLMEAANEFCKQYPLEYCEDLSPNQQSNTSGSQNSKKTSFNNSEIDNFVKLRRASFDESVSQSKNREEQSDREFRLKRLRTFIDDFALRTMSEERNIEEDENRPSAVTVTTCHQAKGLEWKAVFIVRANEGVSPLSFKNEEEQKDSSNNNHLEVGFKEKMEEERRLMYVAISRACEQLFISYILSNNMLPSRFLGDIPKDLVEHVKMHPFRSKDLKPSYSYLKAGNRKPTNNFGAQPQKTQVTNQMQNIENGSKNRSINPVALDHSKTPRYRSQSSNKTDRMQNVRRSNQVNLPYTPPSKRIPEPVGHHFKNKVNIDCYSTPSKTSEAGTPKATLSLVSQESSTSNSPCNQDPFDLLGNSSGSASLKPTLQARGFSDSSNFDDSVDVQELLSDIDEGELEQILNNAESNPSKNEKWSGNDFSDQSDSNSQNSDIMLTQAKQSPPCSPIVNNYLENSEYKTIQDDNADDDVISQPLSLGSSSEIEENFFEDVEFKSQCSESSKDVGSDVELLTQNSSQSSL